MDQPKSIFNDTVADVSNQSIYSIARWSRFLGVVTGILGIFILSFGFGINAFANDVFLLLQDIFSTNPLFDTFQLLPFGLMISMVFLFAALLLFTSFALFKISKSGHNYYHTQEHAAFIKMMQFVRILFVLGIITTLIMMIPSILTLSRIL